MRDADDPDFRYSDILDHAASGGERALAEVGMRGQHLSPAEVIDESWDPLLCEARLLPLLIYAYGVNLYEDIWPEEVKRRWIADNWSFLSKRGSLRAIREALAPSGYTVQQAVRPPQGIFATEDHNKEEIDAWIKRMPELRVTYQDRTGKDNGQAFGDDTFADDTAAGFDDGALLSGRYAFLRQNGQDIPLHTLTESKSIETVTSADYEQYTTVGQSEMGEFADESFADDDFADAADSEPQIYTMRIDHSYDHMVSVFELTQLTVSLTPIDARHEVTSDIGKADGAAFADDCFADEDACGKDEAARMLADSVRLLDPSISLPATAGWSFADVDRVGMELRTAELMIDLHTTATAHDTFADETFATETYALDEDTSHIDRALRAVEAARGHQDRILVRFDTLRLLEAGDTVDDETRVGDWVKESL